MSPQPESPSVEAAHPQTPVPPVPFLKWPGGKRWLVDKHPKLFQRTFDRYIEPFLGAGSIYFHLAPHRAVLSDLNADLMTAYQGIKERHEAVQRLLEQHHSKHCEDYYYEIRSHTPSSLEERAARLIYLNRTCFNGIYRVNRYGSFNVPIGTRTRVVKDTDDFATIARLLANAELHTNDFETIVDRAQDGDLLFIDPPYKQ